MTQWVWPRTGWRRAFEYLAHRLRRLPDSPHKIALGFSCGVFVSFSPFFGLHFIYAGLCALIVRGNVLAAFLGTLVGNPVTFPFMAAASLTVGNWLFGVDGEQHGFNWLKDQFFDAAVGLWRSLKSLVGFGAPEWGPLGEFFMQVFLPYWVGGILPGLITGAIFYAFTRPLVAAYQARRRSRLMARARMRVGSPARPG